MDLIRLILQVIALLRAVFDGASLERGRGLGRSEAIAASLGKSMAAIREARRIEQDAASRHAADPTDAAFDAEFKRTD